MESIHWYPGHMAKAKRQLAELLRYIDIILEIRDARLPLASHNSDLDPLLRKRPNLVILNKVDLANPAVTDAWVSWFRKADIPVVMVNGKNGQGVQGIWSVLTTMSPPEKRNRPLRVGVVGIPNVGKSTLLNRLLGTGAAKTGNTPGVTRGKQWIKKNGCEILDTPGLLPPKIGDPEDGIKLALVGTIREEIIPAYDLSLILLKRYGEVLFEWNKNEVVIEDPEDGLDWYAKKRGFLIKGGAPDLNRAASSLLSEFRNGRLGRISLEHPAPDGTASE